MFGLSTVCFGGAYVVFKENVPRGTVGGAEKVSGFFRPDTSEQGGLRRAAQIFPLNLYIRVEKNGSRYYNRYIYCKNAANISPAGSKKNAGKRNKKYDLNLEVPWAK